MYHFNKNDLQNCILLYLQPIFNLMYQFLVLIFLLISVPLKAQIHELGIYFGGSNYIGDVGSTTYISPNSLNYGLIYKKNQNTRLAYRISINSTTLKSNDLNSNEVSRKLRGYSFANKITELAGGIEFNFSEFDLEKNKNKFVPYFHFGLAFTLSKDAIATPTQIAILNNTKGTIALPIDLGIKSNILPHFILSIEIGARYTLSDNLDGSNPRNQGVYEFGNINNNDWYVFTGMTLTYTFGKKPCYCTDK